MNSATTALAPAEESAGAGAAEAGAGRWDRVRRTLELRNAGVVYAFILLLVGLSAVSAVRGRPGYLNPANVGNLLEQTSLTAILAIGMTVLLISGNFDLSVGSLTALTAMCSALVANEFGPIAAVTAGLLVGVIGGAINGLVQWRTGLNSFIVTLGSLTAYRGITLWVSDGSSVNVSRDAGATLTSWVGSYVTLPNLILVAAGLAALAAVALAVARRWPATIAAAASAAGLGVAAQVWSYPLRLAQSSVVMLAVLAVAWFFLRFTVTGRRLYAVGGNSEAARASGIVVSRYRVIPFVIVGLCAGIAGVLWTARLNTVDPNVFTGQELQVLAAAIVGGVALTGGAGTAAKTFIGALLLVTMSNGFNILNVAPAAQQVFTGLLVVAAAGVYAVAERKARGRA